ncbi:MAG: sterol desaturase family protein [Verrucomicrobia bacterium]|nr:sterol desaturase family protein [Verrucomicrobiota bacterium]
MAPEISPNEPAIRLGFFLGVFALVALWEQLTPRRARSISRWQRWPGNLGVALLDTLLTRIIAPTGAVGFAMLAESRGWGALHFVAWPTWLELLIALLCLDLAIYLQHRAFHFVPALWRLHRMHHADLEFDVTTGARFHPLEILLSLAIKFIVIVPLGASSLAVLVFEIALNATAMFNHGNVRLPASVERALRWLVVTPDMHRVHHSVVRRETDSNFGFNFPWWDHVFGTYRPQPAAGYEGMTIGLHEFRSPRELRLNRMLTQPFRDEQALDTTSSAAKPSLPKEN